MNLMRWKQNKMAAKGESSSDCTPSTYSPLTRKPSGPHSANYSVPQGDASSYTHPNSHSQYDALPVGTLGTYDPAADEIDYSFYQNARPNRRRLLYSRASAEPDLEDDRGLGDTSLLLNGSGRRKNRGKKDLGPRSRSSSELADMSAEDSLMEEAELSTETLYVMLLVLASTAVTMLAAYLILL